MKILIANSLKKRNKPLNNFFKNFPSDFEMFFWVEDEFVVKNLNSAKRGYFGPAAGGRLELFFIFYFLFSTPFYFFWLLAKKIKLKIQTVVLIESNEKIILTFLARLLGIKVVWLELPEKKYNKWAPSTWILAVFSRLARLVFFNDISKELRIKSGFLKNNFFNIFPVADLDYARQDNLFSELAVSDKPYKFLKNFSIGAVVDFSVKGQLESLLKVVKNCSNIIPNIQLVIIGASSERRNLNWLVKKLGIEKMVWLVGEQEDLIKWLDSFDLYFSLSDEPSLLDLETVLAAMSRGVPPVVFDDKNFQEFIINNETGFVAEKEKIDELTKKIISIELNKKLLKDISLKVRRLVFEQFNRKKQVEAFLEVIK